MKLGVTFPQTEIGVDPVAVRDFAQAAEALGYTHLLAYDHVLGVSPEVPGYRDRYNATTTFHEPLVLFGYLAGVTRQIELATDVIVLPQRQTALVAKQAAEVDLLSGGRLRLGVGVGWNQFEYEALGKDFHNRGRRQEEQVELLRQLWASTSIDFDGRWERVRHAGINPLPTRRIPIWFGGGSETTLDRAARLGDGWICLYGPGPQFESAVATLRDSLQKAGRDPSTFGIEAGTHVKYDENKWARHLQAWAATGVVSHVSVITMGAGLDSPQQHIDIIRRYKKVADEVLPLG
jgi:probable F420-dependent oxidoreductase